MGVKYLWSILEPVCKEKSVSELFGKRLAIDTSCWVVSDNQLLPSHIVKPHLRNLFFRTASLLDNGIDPVYVLEGEAPKLKAQVMKKRQELRFGSSQASKATSTTRSRYNFVQKECKQLLDALGVVTFFSAGEAEAACASLNQHGKVDGCITIDGDAFLYGARTVYRNLSTNTSHFVCQEYSMDLIESRLNLSRDKLVVIGILLGCDYLPEGAGVSKDPVLRVMSTWKDGQVTDAIKSWAGAEVEDSIPARPAHCSQCKHPGSLRGHAKSGCTLCNNFSCEESNIPCHCDWHRNEVLYEKIAIQTKVSQLKRSDVEEIIEEFYNEIYKERIENEIKAWQMPSIHAFCRIATEKLKWELTYAAEKVLPLLTRWIVIHGYQCSERSQPPATPLSIELKKRIKRGCPMYQVEWRLNEPIENFPSQFQTLEPQFLIERKFQYLLPQPVPKPLKKTKNSRQKKKAAEKVVTNVVNMFEKMNLETETAAIPPISDSSFLELTSGEDDPDISFIVDIICQRKKKIPVKEQERFNVQECSQVNHNASVDHSDAFLRKDNEHFRKQPLCTAALPNFSLNFSVGQLFETSESSFQVPCNNLATNINSTPQKLKSASDCIQDKRDSFSTPPSLAERFNRVRL